MAVCLIQDLVMKTVGALTAAQLALLPLSGEHVAKLLMLVLREAELLCQLRSVMQAAGVALSVAVSAQ